MLRLMVRSLAVMAVVAVGSTLTGPTLLDQAAAHRESSTIHALAPTEVIVDLADGPVSTGVFALAVVEVEPGVIVFDPPPAIARLVFGLKSLFVRHSADPLAEAARSSAWMAAQEAAGVEVPRGLRLVGEVDPPLREGDVVLTVDGGPASRRAMGAGAVNPGECVGVVREGAAAMVDIPVGYRLGPDVRLEQEPVSSEAPVVEGLEGYAGSSAGLALALAYLRVLTGVAGQAPIRIGATGVLEPGPTAGVWRVSPVGSAGAKAVAAARAGLDAVLVPSRNAAEARAAVAPLGCRTRVVTVDTLDDAVQWLANVSR